MKEISLEKVYMKYSSSLPDVFENLNFRFEPGKFTFLAGKNRVGKTTLMKILGGLVPSIYGQICGEVKVFGHDPTRIDLTKYCKIARYFGPDPYASIHGLTVSQEMMLLARNTKVAKKVLSLMNIKNLWSRETDTLSGGEGIRLVLAGALLSEAELLLLDSPMQELDPMGRQDFLKALMHFRENFEGNIIISDPFWTELKPYIDKILLLNENSTIEEMIPSMFFNNENILRKTNLLKKFPSFTAVKKGRIIAKMKNINVTLNDNHILKGFDFEAEEGELVVITGKNGSGKTTAMLTLAKAIKYQQGNLETEGKVGYVFQHPKLQTVALTIADELKMELRIRKWEEDQIEEYVEDALEWLDLSPEKCPLDLHPADKRLLMIACSKHNKIIIMDEPTIDLDAIDTLKVLKFINERRKEGKTIIVITHDPSITLLADREVIVDEGRVKKERILIREVMFQENRIKNPVCVS